MKPQQTTTTYPAEVRETTTIHNKPQHLSRRSAENHNKSQQFTTNHNTRPAEVRETTTIHNKPQQPVPQKCGKPQQFTTNHNTRPAALRGVSTRKGQTHLGKGISKTAMKNNKSPSKNTKK